MTIKIIDEGELRLTQAEYDRYLREWQKAMQMTVAPVDFETWVRRQIDYKRYDV